MSAPMHSPGPWAITTDGFGYESIVSRPVDTTEDLVAYVFGDNGPLLRSAPAMLEALYQYESDLLHPPTGDSRERRLERVRKVIAEALGQ